MRRISRRIAASPASFMVAGRICVSCRRWCSGSADGGCSPRSASQPEVCHLNEGHAAFAVLERAREFHAGERADLRGRAGCDARGQSLHHAHSGGRRLRPLCPGSYRQCLGGYARKELGITLDDLLALGRREPERCGRDLQHGLSGDAGKRRGEWREPPARKSQPAHSFSRSFRAGRRTTCRSGT